MEISIAPAPSTWGRLRFKEFYQKVASMPVDTVYLGEVICAKRKVLTLDDFKEIASLLQKNNKRVVFSTPALITSLDELEEIKGFFSVADAIEANN